jgi:tRNA G37 N-methylase Trm5
VKVSRSFIPQGTTQHDINFKAVLRLKENLELNAFDQVELWKVPVLASANNMTSPAPSRSLTFPS